MFGCYSGCISAAVTSSLQTLLILKRTSGHRGQTGFVTCYLDMFCSRQKLDRLRYLGLWTLEQRRSRRDLIELFKIFKGLSGVGIDEISVHVG